MTINSHMQMDKPYKILDLHVDSELLNFDFSSITDVHWDKNQNLKQKFPDIFADVKPFRVMYLELSKWNDPENHDPVPENDDHPVHALLMNEIRKLEELYNAKAKIVVLDGLPPGGKINRHFDQSKIYDQCHRVHLPLVTDPAVKFFIDDVPYHFRAGEFFEFNNKMYHEVHNDSNIFRIHLVVDLLPNNG